jgi:hypothetical protein
MVMPQMCRRLETRCLVEVPGRVREVLQESELPPSVLRRSSQEEACRIRRNTITVVTVPLADIGSAPDHGESTDQIRLHVFESGVHCKTTLTSLHCQCSSASSMFSSYSAASGITVVTENHAEAPGAFYPSMVYDRWYTQ